MSWASLLDLIADELGPEAAHRIQVLALREMLGERVRIPMKARPPPTPDEIRSALARHRWRVREAAAELGCHPATIYRRLDRQRPKAPAPDPGPQFLGRIIR